MKKFEKISDEERKAHFCAMRAALEAYNPVMFAGESYDRAERRAALRAYNAAIWLHEQSSNKI